MINQLGFSVWASIVNGAFCGELHGREGRQTVALGISGRAERPSMRGQAVTLLEIACDESGYEGEKLIGATTDVFAHASVRLGTESATSCMRELRERIRSPAQEYKANHLLREKHRSALEWLLGASGPLHGNAHVYLVDKAFFVVGRVIDLLVAEVAHSEAVHPWYDGRANTAAVTLYREGRRAFGSEQWHAFLVSANNLMRAKDRGDARTSVDAFFQTVDAMRLGGTAGRVDEILGLLWQARPNAVSFRARLLENPEMIPALDPLIPAIVRAVVHWGEDDRPVSIVHDRQNALSEERVARLKEIFSRPRRPFLGHSPRGRLTSLTFVDSFSDPRVQIADILAGAARKIASDELNEQGDAALTSLVRPYVDPFSIWGDDRSWSVLGPIPSLRTHGDLA